MQIFATIKNGLALLPMNLKKGKSLKKIPEQQDWFCKITKIKNNLMGLSF